MKKNHQISTKNALINLYLNLKYYSSNKKSQKKEEDIEYLSSLNEISLIKYIKDSIDSIILEIVEKKINDYNKKSNEHIQQDYEAMLIKYEKDIRGHIKTEHQLKLFADSLQNNIEDLEKEKKESICNNNYKDIIIEKNNIINELKKEINYNKKLINSYEEKNIKLSENEKKLKNIISKLEKKYKNEIEILNQKLKDYRDKLDNIYLEKEEKNKKNETIYCNSSRHPIRQNLMCNYLENQNINNNHNRIYRNSNNSISINNNHNTTVVNTRPYDKIEKYIINKYPKNNNKDQYQYQNKVKNLKNITTDHSKGKNIRNSVSNISNNSYIIDSKMQDEIINKIMINDSSINNSIKKNKKVYHRHKSTENENNKYIKSKQMNIIKKILMSNNNISTNNNSLRNSCKNINKGIYNNISKKNTYSNNNSTINNSKNFINKSTKEININNIIGNKNNIGCNFVNNINIYSNTLKQDNNNIYIDNNLKKYAGNASVRELINNNHLNSNNYIKIHGNGNKNNMVNYRNKKDGKMITSLTNNIPKDY